MQIKDISQAQAGFWGSLLDQSFINSNNSYTVYFAYHSPRKAPLLNQEVDMRVLQEVIIHEIYATRVSISSTSFLFIVYVCAYRKVIVSSRSSDVHDSRNARNEIIWCTCCWWYGHVYARTPPKKYLGKETVQPYEDSFWE